MPSFHRILSVTGRRGIGKSATVAKVLAEFEQPDPRRGPLEDFDSLVYLSTRTGSGSISGAVVFDTLAGLLEKKQRNRMRRLWETSHQTAFPELWEVMRHQRTILVLDNLDDLQDENDGSLRADDLVALLTSVCATPYPPHVVTTSQLPLRLPPQLQPHVREFPLESGLEGDDAIALLRSRDPTTGFEQFTDDELGRATERLHGVPHGIEMLGSLMEGDLYALDLIESDATLDAILLELVSRIFLGLDEPERHVVELLALSGVPLPERELPQILDGLVTPPAIRDALRTLVRRRGVGFEPRTRTVRLHPVEVDWCRRELLEHHRSEQVALDLRLADWHRARSTPPGQWRSLEDVEPQRLEFQHRWRAGQHDDAMIVLAEIADFLARKGETALLRSALADADTVALGLPAQVATRRCRLEVEFFSGSLESAQTIAREALELASQAGMSSAADELRVDLGTVLRHQGDNDEAVRMLQEVARQAAPVERRTRLEALFELGLALCYQQRWGDALGAADELAETLCPEDGTKLAAGPADIRALAGLGSGDHELALAAAEEAIRLYLDSPHQDNAGYAHNVAGLVWLERDDLDRARTQLEEGEQTAVRFKIDRLAGICATNLAWTELRAGNVGACAAAAHRACERLDATGARAAKTPRALAELVADRSVDRSPPLGEDRDPREVLASAATASADNADFYRPSTDVLTAIALPLAKRSGVSARQRG
ncbi:AAA family ATPase [Nocardioides sp. AN3]